MLKWKNINWLFVATAFTTAYLLLIIFWIGPCKIIAFTATSELNAIGDFLAGMFSPLAFIWLVAAVLTQRQELTDTRRQFAENQQVVDAQLNTINDQSLLLHQQHTLAEQTAKKTYKLSLFEQRFTIYNELVKLNSSMSVQITEENWNFLQDLTSKASFVFGPEIVFYLECRVSEIRELFVFEASNAKAWATSQPYLSDYPTNPEDEAIRYKASSDRRKITGLLSREALKEVVWSDMYVSEA